MPACYERRADVAWRRFQHESRRQGLPIARKSSWRVLVRALAGRIQRCRNWLPIPGQNLGKVRSLSPGKVLPLC